MNIRKEEELYLSHSFIPTIAEATVVGVMVLDSQLRIKWINEAALAKTGLSEKEALGRYCYQISHNSLVPCDSPESPCPMKETLKTGKSAHAIHEHVLNDKTCYCDVSTFPLFDGNGQIVQVLEVIRDITRELNDRLDRRTLSIKNDLSQLVLEDKLVSLGKLVASVAHEINNPIGSIINFNKLILKTITENRPSDQDLNEFKRYLDLSIREAQRCGMIVNNLLSFSRQKTIEAKRIDLAELINTIVLLTGHTMELAMITVSLDIEPPPLEVWGDYTQIQQCFTNFVFNAIEAMPQGGRLTITAGMEADRETVLVTVADTGVGIQDTDIDRIFEPFFTTKEALSCVGLGLSMVYGIIKEHKGSISVKSQVNQGTVFQVCLPVNP